MIKKILLISLFILTTLYGKSIGYEDPNKFDYLDIRPFVGVEYGYAYGRNDSSNKLENYSYYVGIPYRQYEIIVKNKHYHEHNFNIEAKSAIVNIPISGSGTNLFYYGFVFSKATLKWDDSKVAEDNLQDNKIKKNIYGIHIGNKYKFQRHFYVKIECEYTRYNMEDSVYSSKAYLDDSLELIYGVEYRF